MAKKIKDLDDFNIKEVVLEDKVLTDEDIKAIPRSLIRYALFRYRSGNEEIAHLSIINYYLPRLEKFKLDRHDFSDIWDIDKNDVRNIVSGHTVMKYKEDLEESLFDEDGKLKEASE